jgi:hypothetical protein
LAGAQPDELRFQAFVNEVFPFGLGMTAGSHKSVDASATACDNRKNWHGELDEGGEPERGIDLVAFHEKVTVVGQTLLSAA